MAVPRSQVAIRDVITAFYRVLLMREPDEEGLADHAASIASGERTLDEMLGAFFASQEFRSIASDVLGANGSGIAVPFMNEHSQFGEIGLLVRRWVNDAARHKIVVDVGARGRQRSNSYDLLREFGWRGILIEANPALIDGIRGEFSDLDYELLNCAVSDYDGRATFHIGVNDDVSSLNADASLGWGAIQGEVAVDVKRLHPLLLARGVPMDFDLLSLDIEGEDLKVLNDLVAASPYRPRWVIIEASFNFATRSLDDLALNRQVKAQYRIADQTAANLILQVRA